MNKFTAFSLICPLMLSSAAMAGAPAKKAGDLNLKVKPLNSKSSQLIVTDGDSGLSFETSSLQIVPNILCDLLIQDSKGRGIQVLKNYSGELCKGSMKQEDGNTSKPLNARQGSATGRQLKSLSKPALACVKKQITNFALASRQNPDYAQASHRRTLNSIIVLDNSAKKVSDADAKVNGFVAQLSTRAHCEDLPNLAIDFRCREGGELLNDKEIEFLDSTISVSSKGECEVVPVADYEKTFKELADHDAQLAKAQEKPAIDPNQAVKELMGDAGAPTQASTIDTDASVAPKAINAQDAKDGGAPAPQDSGAANDAGSSSL